MALNKTIYYHDYFSTKEHNMLKDREPYEKISRQADTPLENVMEIAKRNNLAYN
ncbi:hypothetical protein [Anaerovibrio sp.]|uniref:hypothetical protein n=1 Tax=Anaerovibrio sp. TaxID=1872532 RepID=UPI00388DB0A5